MEEWIIKYWVQVLFGAIAGAFASLYGNLRSRTRKEKERMVALERGMQALLRDRIIQSGNHYLEKGKCPIYARENIEAMLKEYQNLGGNGTIKDLVEEVFELPFK